jgi:hypothetical protein
MAKVKAFYFGNLSGLPYVYGGVITHHAVRDTALKAMEELESICDVKFAQTSDRSGTRISVKNAENNPHRGTFTSNGNIYLNSAIGGPKWPDKKWYGVLQVLKIMRHEIGHLLGLKHSKHIEDVMHPHASAFRWSDREVAKLVKKFGPPGGKLVLEKDQPNSDMRRDMKAAAKILRKKYRTGSEQLEAVRIATGLILGPRRGPAPSPYGHEKLDENSP